MRKGLSSPWIVFVPLAVAAAVACSPTTPYKDETLIDTSIFFHRPIYLLPDSAIVEAYRGIGYEASRKSQLMFSQLFNSLLDESDTPIFAYLTSQVVRNATLLGEATNNSSLLRLYEVLLKNKETMRRYRLMDREFSQFREWLFEKKDPPPRMERMMKETLVEFDRLGLRPWSGQLVEMLADYYFYLRRDEEGLQSLEDALAREVDGEHISLVSHTAGRIGVYHLRRGELAEAEASILQSLRYARLSRDPYYLARALSFLAELRAAQGRFAEADSLISRSIEESKTTGNPRDEFARITNLAELEVSFGEYSHAATVIERALLMADEILAQAQTPNDALGRNATAHYAAECLMLRATIELARNEPSASIATTRLALETCRGATDRGFEAQLKKKLGDAYAASGRNSEAMQCYEEALAASGKAREREKEAECLNAIATLRLGGGEYRAAEKILKRAVQIEGTESWMEKVRTLDILARAEAGLGEYGAAKNLLEESISTAERQLAERRFVENRYALSGQLRDILADLLELEGEHLFDAEELIAAAEKARQLRIGERGIQRRDLDAGIRRCLAERDWIPENAAVIQHILVPHGLIIAAMDRHGETYRIVPIEPEKLEAQIAAFIEACVHAGRLDGEGMRPEASAAIEDQARALYHVLLEPMTALISSKEILCFIPDEPLRALPFGALEPSGPGGRFLIEGKCIIASPNLLAASSGPRSASGSRRGFSSSLIVSGPEITDGIRMRYPTLSSLPNAGAEIVEVSRIVGRCSVIGGSRGTKETILAKMRKADHIHVAAHRIPYPAESGESALLISGRGAAEAETFESSLITESEIEKLDLSEARLVFLSTCESAAAGKNVETMGLAGAFLDAGAQSVVATVWPIEDKEALQFVTGFYREMMRGKSNPQQALQTVQRRMIATDRSQGVPMSNIRTWAPYLFLGPLRKF